MKSKRSSYLLYFIYISAFILINLISMNYFKRIDLTDNKMYSLSDSSKLTIDKIDDPLIIDLYFSDDLPGQLQNNRRYIQDILEEYAAYNNHINFYFIKNDEKFSSKAKTEEAVAFRTLCFPDRFSLRSNDLPSWFHKVNCEVSSSVL